MVGRWDLGAIEELQGYLRIVARTLLETLGEIEREMKPRGRSASVQHTIDEVTDKENYTQAGRGEAIRWHKFYKIYYLT